jgi:hypothetical protein
VVGCSSASIVLKLDELSGSRLGRAGQHTVIREKRNQRRHWRIARAAQSSRDHGESLILVVNRSAVHRTGAAVLLLASGTASGWS